jgi:hypothetical protein
MRRFPGGFPAGEGDAGSQALRVLVLRAAEHVTGVALLDDLAFPQHDDLLGELPDHGQVVTDQDVRHPGLVPDVSGQVQHLRLDRHIECRDRLVQDQDPRRRSEGPGDRDPLPLAAGQHPGQAR